MGHSSSTFELAETFCNSGDNPKKNIVLRK